MEKGLLYYDGKLTPGLFYNIVIAGIRSRDFQWLQTFLEENKNLIIGDSEEKEFYRVNQAYYYFATGAYDTALGLIPASLQDSHYVFNARRLEIMAYFELDSELLPYKIDAFRMLISRTGPKLLSQEYLASQSDFIYLLLQIIGSKAGDKARSEKIILRIQSKPQAAEFDWLLEKAKQIAKH